MFDEKRIGRERRTKNDDEREEAIERRRRHRRQVSMREISFTEWARYFAAYQRRK